jgi:hypothetical protein
MPHTGRRPLRHFPPHGEPNRLSGLNISAAMQPVIGKKYYFCSVAIQNPKQLSNGYIES